jgi:hypothetical protein
MISNIVFTKNRPLQLDAYLESLYKYFPSKVIQTYIIYKEELFAKEYEQLFGKYKECIVIKESDFHSDFMRTLEQAGTKYILFGIDDVVYFDSVNLEVIEDIFEQQGENIFGFTLRFSPESLKGGGDIIEEHSAAGEKVFSVNWKNGRMPLTRYPFELCCTIYSTRLVKKIIYGSMNNNPFAKRFFSPSSAFIRFLSIIGRKRSTLKRFGYFFSPNTLESWPCRWCRNNNKQLPDYIYFQKLCASAIQVNMVNTSTGNEHHGVDEHTVESLNNKYKEGYRLDINYISENKPNATHCGKEHVVFRKQ